MLRIHQFQRETTSDFQICNSSGWADPNLHSFQLHTSHTSSWWVPVFTRATWPIITWIRAVGTKDSHMPFCPCSSLTAYKHSSEKEAKTFKLPPGGGLQYRSLSPSQ